MDPRRGPELVGVPRQGTGRIEGLSGKFGTDRGTLGKVPNGSRDPRGVPERVKGPSMRSGIGRETRNGSGEPLECPGRFVGPLGRLGKGQGTLGQDRDGLGDSARGPERVVEEVRNGSGDPRVGPGRVGVPSERFGTGLRTLGEVRNGS